MANARYGSVQPVVRRLAHIHGKDAKIGPRFTRTTLVEKAGVSRIESHKPMTAQLPLFILTTWLLPLRRGAAADCRFVIGGIFTLGAAGSAERTLRSFPGFQILEESATLPAKISAYADLRIRLPEMPRDFQLPVETIGSRPLADLPQMR